MSAHSIEDFLARTREKQPAIREAFEFESERLLQVNLDSSIWIKHGAMIAYRGEIHFERMSLAEQGASRVLKKVLTGEGTTLTKAQGKGSLYLADSGKKISLLRLENQELVVNGRDILAFEPTLNWDIKFMRRIMAIAAGGLFNVRLTGSGRAAITTHYDPLTLAVEPGRPVFTDPNATVAWSGNLQPEFKTDMQLKTFLGRGSGESLQMAFHAELTGPGFVVVQPYEERPMMQTATPS